MKRIRHEPSQQRSYYSQAQSQSHRNLAWNSSNEFILYFEALKAATKLAMLCLLSRLQTRVKKDIRGCQPWSSVSRLEPSRREHFARRIYRTCASRSLFLAESGSFTVTYLGKVLAYARAALPSKRFVLHSTQPRMIPVLDGFLGQQVSLRCLRRRYRAIYEGQFVVG